MQLPPIKTTAEHCARSAEHRHLRNYTLSSLGFGIRWAYQITYNNQNTIKWNLWTIEAFLGLLLVRNTTNKPNNNKKKLIDATVYRELPFMEQGAKKKRAEHTHTLFWNHYFVDDFSCAFTLYRVPHDANRLYYTKHK